MSSLTRSQSLRAPSSRTTGPTSSSTVTTRAAARAATSSTASSSSSTPSSIAAPTAARPRPQIRTASPTVPTIPTRQHARTISAGSVSSASPRTMTTTTTTTSTTTGVKPPARSLSASLLGRPRPTTTTAAAGGGSGAGGAVKDPAVPARKEARHYPPSTALTRPPVTPRPRSSMGIASSSSSPASKLPSQLARPRSSAANREPVSPRPQPQTLRRPLSQASTRTPGAASPTVQRSVISVEKGASSKPPPPPRPPSLGLGRSIRAQQPARPPSASAAAATSSSTASTSSGPTSTSTSTPTSRNTASTPTPTVSRVRSGFSTVQRHYSPSASPAPTPPPKPARPAAPKPALKPSAKPAPRTAAPKSVPKPAALKTSVSSQYLRTSTTPTTPSRSPVRSPANVPPPSSEISKLQAELLQLYLLHEEAVATDAAWQASAKAKLGERFLRISEENQEAADKERAAMERINVLALSRWSARGSTSLDERIQALEAVISGCWSLSDPGGRYASVVSRFEDWVDGVAGVQEARKRPEAALGNEHVLFIGELDAAWRAEREELMQRLDGWKKQLDEIDDLGDHDRNGVADSNAHGHGESEGEGEGDERSGLERMLGAARSLIGDMVAELDLMGVMEREAQQQEEEWIEKMNSQDDDGALRAGPAWRV